MKRFKYLTLAALVAFAACDEGTETVVEPPVTGTISGVVTIEGVGASGVTVTLSSGQTTSTDGSGSYAFSGVSAGAYTVSISGFASDATFSSTSKAATITTAGQVVTVNFDGSYVRTSAILGSVAAGGSGLSGVTVSLSGGSSTTTDANGQYAFSGLRAGSYTVSISGFDASQYTFSTTSQSVSVGVGESKVVSFSGQLLTTAKIMGSLYIDENDNNNNFDEALEDKLAVANVAVTIEGGAVNDTMTVMTDANGDYMFENLAAGTYRVILDNASPAIPGNVTFGGASNMALVTVTTGATGVVNWPFDIAQQAVKVAAFYGRDGTAPGVAPVNGVTINLFAQEADAVAGTPILATATTDASGMVTFRFPRTADTSPSGSQDHIVFAEVAGVPANHAVNGETRLEISYPGKDSLAMAPDTFDLLTSQAIVSMNAMDALGQDLSGWSTSWWRNDTTAARFAVGATNSNGVDSLTVNISIPQLPDTFYVRLASPNAGAAGHGFTQTAKDGADGVAVNGRTLMVIHDGTSPTGNVIDAGTEEISFTDMDVTARIHHEADDSTDTPVFTGGDDFTRVTSTQMELFKINADGTRTSVTTDAFGGALTNPVTPAVGTGWATWTNIPLGDYEVRARPTVSFIDVLNDTTAMITLDGLAMADTLRDLTGNAGISTFAHKHNNTTLRGVVQSEDGVTPAGGIQVRIQATADNIQPNISDTTVSVGAGGGWRVDGFRDGPYTITVSDSVTADGTVWAFEKTLTQASAPLISGSADNDDAHSATRDTDGSADIEIANFEAVRWDTKIAGVVVNDRDSDYNTLDPDEALSGVTIDLYNDDDADGVIDSGTDVVIASTTTDATGGYMFTWLREDDYIVKANSPADVVVLRALSATGDVTDQVAVTTTAAAGAGATLNQNGTRQVGNTSPPAQNDELPRWNYLTGTAAADGGNLGAGAGPNATNGATTITPTHFVHLFQTGTVTGKLVDGSGSPAVGVRVTITRCQTAPAAPSPPAGGACTAKHGSPSPHIQNFDTDSNGAYTFSGLLEGVYQIDVAPATGGYTTNIGPDGVAASGDEIMLATIQGNNDVETVPDYEVN